MKFIFNFPDIFVPQERDFQIYCAVILYKNKYISEEEAINICGYSKFDKKSKVLFNNNCLYFEERYKILCNGPLTDWVVKNDPKNI